MIESDRKQSGVAIDCCAFADGSLNRTLDTQEEVK